MFTPKKHSCKKKSGYVVETTMSGVKEIWIIYDEIEDSDEEAHNIVYDIIYCPFCGQKLQRRAVGS